MNAEGDVLFSMRSLHTAVFLLAASSCVLPPWLHGQEARPGRIVADTLSSGDSGQRLLPLRLQPGTRLRIQLSQSVLQGALLSSSSDTIFLRSDTTSPIAIPAAEVRGIEYRFDAKQRRSRVWRGVAIGTVTGLIAGGLVGLTMPLDDGKCGDLFLDPFCEESPPVTHEENVLVGMTIGVMYGAVGGGTVALVRSKGWRRYPLRKITVAPLFKSGSLYGARASAQLSWSFGMLRESSPTSGRGSSTTTSP